MEIYKTKGRVKTTKKYIYLIILLIFGAVIAGCIPTEVRKEYTNTVEKFKDYIKKSQE